MLIRVDASAAMPVYEQIRQQVVKMVAAGTLGVGARLPTIRQLAGDLGIARGTVAKAYSILESAAVVETRGHRGTFVLPVVTGGVDHDLTDDAEALVVAAVQAGQSLSEAVEALTLAWNRLGPSD